MRLLDAGMILAHPLVIGEIALGHLRRRKVVLSALSDLPRAGVATDDEVLRFIDRHALFGRGVGFIDAHLLAAVRLTPGAALWAAIGSIQALHTPATLTDRQGASAARACPQCRPGAVWA